MVPSRQTHDSSSTSSFPFLLPQSQISSSSSPRSPLSRPKRDDSNDNLDDDDAMWSLLLDWVTQEQQEGLVMAADEARPPLPPIPPIPQRSSDAEVVEDSEGSGDHDPKAKLSVQSKSITLSVAQQKTADDFYEDNSEEAEPASMAIAESLILLHPLPLTAAAAIGSAHHRTVTADSSVKTVFAYDDPLVEIVQLDPFVSLPSSSSSRQLTFVNDSSAGDGFVLDPLVATAPTATATELFERQDVDDTTWTSNETLPPDNGEPLFISWPEERESSSDLFNTGTPPPSSVLLSLAGNITEDILSLERWPDVVSYRGTPAPPVPAPSPPSSSSFDAETQEALSSPCECVCPSPSDVNEMSSTIAPIENLSNPVTTVAATTDQPLIPDITVPDIPVTTTTSESPTAFSTLTTPATATAIGGVEEYQAVEDDGSTIYPVPVPTCPSFLGDTTTTTTPLPMTTPTTTATTALPIPPILILEGERTEDIQKT